MPKKNVNLAGAGNLVEKECRENIFYFIDRFVRIEDRDSAELAIPFKLWDKQKEALVSFLNHRLTVVLKARQLGLTWLALSYAVWKMIFNPGYAVTALSRSESEAQELVRRTEFILRYLPKWLIREKKQVGRKYEGITFEATTTKITIHHPGKEPSTFTSMTSSQNAGRSFTVNLVILDEWAFQQWAREIWRAAYPTVNRPTGGQVIGISTAERGTLFEEIWERAEKKENNFYSVFLPWYSDPRRDAEWYENAKKEFPNDYMAEYPATPAEAFSAGQSTAIPEFDYNIHTCDPFPIPRHWKRWMGVDHGSTDPFAWYWFAVDEEGTVYIYREFTREENDPKIRYSDQAREVIQLSTYYDPEQEREYQEEIMFIAAGHEGFNKHPETGKSIINYYEDAGLKGFIVGMKDRRFRLATWHEYLRTFENINTGEKTAKVKIFRTCRKLIETLPKLQVDKHDHEKVEDKGDHWFDGAGYGLCTWHTNKTKALEKPMTRIEKHKNKLAKKLKKQVFGRLT